MRRLALALFALILTSPFAAAQDEGVLEVDQVLCRELATVSEEDLGYLLIWLDGYFNHKFGQARMSNAALEALATLLMEGCGVDPEANLLDMLSDRLSEQTLNHRQ